MSLLLLFSRVAPATITGTGTLDDLTGTAAVRTSSTVVGTGTLDDLTGSGTVVVSSTGITLTGTGTLDSLTGVGSVLVVTPVTVDPAAIRVGYRRTNVRSYDVDNRVRYRARNN